MDSAYQPFVRIERPRWFSGFQSRVTLYSRSPPAWYRDKFEQRIESLRVVAGSPETLLEVKGAYFIPGHVCLYDREGRRIDASCVRRKPAQWSFVDAGPETIALPADCATLEKPMLYLAGIASHWGHFLIDGVSRLWARAQFAELRDVDCFAAAAVPKVLQARDYLDALGLTRQIQFSPRPIRLDTCFIPGASFSDRGECYTAHLRPFQAVTAGVDLTSRPPVAQPAYLSRSKFGLGRKIRREVELEERLSGHGVRIVHPEQLSLAEQVEVFNAHEVFIGCWGSAFHGLCFARAPGRTTTHMLCETIPNPNFLMFDAMLGCTPNYIQGMFETPGAPQVWPNFDLTIDVEAVLGYLREAGCI